MHDSLGDRMKDIEGRTRYYLPRRCYTLIRLDGKSFHQYTKKCERPFDINLREDMGKTMLYLCENIQGCKIGYTQSDEISLLLTDFDETLTEAWFDGNIQKIVSVSASMAGVIFNRYRYERGVPLFDPCAVFDARVWTTSDPWEVYNTFLWRQQDCTKNAIQMVARTVASHKELLHKNSNELQELIHQKGLNFDDYPIDCKRGTFCYKTEKGWLVDKEAPILSQDKEYFFNKIPFIES